MAAPISFNRHEKPSMSVVNVTPEMAARWLALNHVNRNVRSKKVQAYACDMRNGDWKLTGESIKFGKSGKLIDGQHRLQAVVESGVTVTMFVARGIDDAAQGVIDSGSARTAADNLSMAGYKNGPLIAAIARRRISLTSFNDLTNSQVYEYVEHNPEIHVVADFVTGYRAGLRDITPSTLGLALWMIAEVNGFGVADQFFTAAAQKVGLVQGDPVLAMTTFFAESRRLKRRVSVECQLSAIIRAFNARSQHQSLKTIRVNNGNSEPIGIPKVRKVALGVTGPELQQHLIDSLKEEAALYRGSSDNWKRLYLEAMVEIGSLRSALEYARAGIPVGEYPDIPRSAVSVPISPRGD